MRKALLLIPSAALLLTGCFNFNLSFDAFEEDEEQHFNYDEQEEEDREMPADKHADYSSLTFRTTFTDETDNNKQYKVHEGAPANGGEYLFGFNKTYNGSDDMYFFHGGPHMDNNGTYPFYLGCKANSAKGCARIKVEYVDANDVSKGFNLKIISGEGFTYGTNIVSPGNYYEGKYLEFYNAVNSTYTSGKNQTSMRAVEKSALGEWGTFIFREYIQSRMDPVDALYYGPCIWMQNPNDADDNKEGFKGFGTTKDYVSIDCTTESEMCSSSQYTARFWEPVE